MAGGTTDGAQAGAADTLDANDPDVKRCDTSVVQPGWVFRGACRNERVKPAGSKLTLQAYRGFSVVETLPRNNVKKDHFIFLFDATGDKDITRHDGKAFPARANAFLYFKTLDRGPSIAFRQQAAATVDFAVSGAGLGGACNVARLVRDKGTFAWRTIGAKVQLANGEVAFEIPLHDYARILHGASYYAFSCSGGPSPSPSPSTSPSTSPSSSPAPTPTPPSAYCKTIATPVPNGNSAPQKVTFADNSGTGAGVYLYVVTGTNPATPGSTQTQYLATNGTLQNFTSGATAPPLPLSCFPGSTGGKGLSFELPPPTNAAQSGNLYIAYATPGPGGAVPNPLPFQGVSNGGNSAPSLDWQSSAYVATPFDVVEYTLPSGITDLTQVDKVGLPLQLTQGSTTIGFASGAQYANLLNAMEAVPNYNKLLVSGSLNGKHVLARILAPQDGLTWGFPQDWWYNSAYTGTTSSAASQGYVGYVLSQYQSSPRLYTLSGLAGFSGNYCASSDGTANVTFYSVGSASGCSNLTGTPQYTMPVAQTLEGTNVSIQGVCESGIFAMPYGGAGGPLADETEFYLWKAMVIDFARGTILSSASHPVGGWNTSPATLPPFSTFYQEATNNTYAKLVHTYMIGHLSYALPYDEPGGYAPTFTSVPSETLQVTIHPIPAYNAPLPTTPPTPLPCP